MNKMDTILQTISKYNQTQVFDSNKNWIGPNGDTD